MFITNPSQPIAQTAYGFDGDQEKLAKNLLNIKVIRPRLIQSKIVFEFVNLMIYTTVWELVR